MASNPLHLTKDNVVDLASFHAIYEEEELDKCLDRFLKIYSRNKSKFIKLIGLHSGKDEKSSLNFMLAIRFLRNFKSHHLELEIEKTEDLVVLRKEVFGLMASILQAVMNPKQLSNDDQTLLREIFFEEKIRGCLQETELEKVKSGFQYSFPELFTSKKWIEGNWFTADNSKNKVSFISSEIEDDVLEFVTECFVMLYEKRLRKRYYRAEHKRVVNMLKEPTSRTPPEHSGDVSLPQTRAGSPRSPKLSSDVYWPEKRAISPQSPVVRRVATRK